MNEQENVNGKTETMFFLGAGASVKAGIKDVIKLVDELVSWLDANNPELSKVTRKIIEIIRMWEKSTFNEEYLNIETLLEIVEKLEESFDDVLSDFFRDKELKFDQFIQILPH